MADHDHIAGARLRADTRKWVLAKMLPKIYGDKPEAEVSSKDGGPIQSKGPCSTGDDRFDALSKRWSAGLRMIEGDAPGKPNGS